MVQNEIVVKALDEHSRVLNEVLRSLNKIHRASQKNRRAAKKANQEQIQATRTLGARLGTLSNKLGFVAFRWQFMGTIARNTLISLVAPFAAIFFLSKNVGIQMARLEAFALGFGEAAKDGTNAAAALTAEVRRLGSGETKFGLQEIALAATELTRAGLDAEQVTAALTDVVHILAVEEIGAEEAAIGLVVAMRAYNLEADDMTHITDVLVNVNNQSTATLNSLIRSMGYASAQASRMGFSMDETATILGVLTDRLGLVRKGSAGRYLAQFGAEMSRLYGPSVNISEMLKVQNERWQTMDNTQREHVIKTLGLSRRALDTYLKLMGMVPGELEAMTEAANESGSAQEMFNRQHKTFGYQLGRVQAAVGSLGEAFTESFEPALREIADLFQELAREEGPKGLRRDIQKLGSAISNEFVKILRDGYGIMISSVELFRKFGVTSETLAKALFYAVAGLTSMFVVARTFGLIFTFIAAFAQMGKALVWVGEKLGWVGQKGARMAPFLSAWALKWASVRAAIGKLSVMLLTAGGVIFAITAVIFTVIAAIGFFIMKIKETKKENQSWTSATSELIRSLEGWPPVLREIAQFLTAAAGGIIIWVDAIWKVIVAVGGSIEYMKDKVLEFLKDPKEKLDEFITWCEGKLGDLKALFTFKLPSLLPKAYADDGETEMLSLGELVTNFVNDIKTRFTGMVTHTKTKLGEWKDSIKEKITTAVDDLKQKIGEWKDNFTEKISTAADETWEKIAGWCGDVQQRFEDWRSDVTAKIEAMVATGKEKITTWVNDTWIKIKDWVTNVTNKFISWKDDVIKKVTEFKNDIINKITAAVDITYDVFVNFWDDVKAGFIGLVDKTFNWGKNLLQNFIDGIWSLMPSLNSVITTVSNKFSDMWEGESPPKKGPLSTIDQWGGNLMNELTTGVRNASPQVSDLLSMKPYNTGLFMGTGADGYGGNAGGPTTITVEINIDKLAESIASTVDIDELIDRFSERVKESFPTILVADR